MGSDACPSRKLSSWKTTWSSARTWSCKLRQRRYDVADGWDPGGRRGAPGEGHVRSHLRGRSPPDGDGTDLLRELQTRPQRPLVVIITGFGSVEIRRWTACATGAFDYLIKPFSSDQLEVTLRKAESFTQLLKVSQYLSHEETRKADTNCWAGAW